MIVYEPKDYSSLVSMEGFGDDHLMSHFHFYRAHVATTNDLISRLSRDAGESPSQPRREALRRRLSWDWNGMRLHELYFENLGGDGSVKDHVVEELLEDQFGSGHRWESDLRAIANTQGVGWASLYYDAREHQLLNVWIDGHGTNHLAGAVPLLVIDLWTHAISPDFGDDRGAYLDAFFANIDWRSVRSRFDEASRDALAMARG